MKDCDLDWGIQVRFLKGRITRLPDVHRRDDRIFVEEKSQSIGDPIAGGAAANFSRAKKFDKLSFIVGLSARGDAWPQAVGLFVVTRPTRDRERNEKGTNDRGKNYQLRFC